ncbi:MULTISPECIES: 3'-5' exonuclease [unclassified Serratia (in: enterobacteria)]|uniref:3'-5' exonuclease n=1 Tax=unclassified Serratia (in: enterobacteria) TaxID=2647522 RepID=UPI00307656EE
MHHLMLDIETLDIAPSAVILVVAAVFFDPKTGKLGAEFEAAINSQKDQPGRTISLTTVAWWAKQSDEARKRAFGGTENLKRVLTHFSRFIHMHSTDSVKVWGNGKEFDCTILEHAFSQLEIPCPWQFWDTQDVRTIITLAELHGFNPKKERPFEGTPHRALDDAKHQARYVADVISALYYRKPSSV